MGWEEGVGEPHGSACLPHIMGCHPSHQSVFQVSAQDSNAPAWVRLKEMPAFGEPEGAVQLNEPSRARRPRKLPRGEYRVMGQRQGWVVNRASEQLEEGQCHQHRGRCIFLES